MASPEELLGKYREKDEKTPQGETIPEKETLNTERMREYVKKNKFTPDNFDQLFTVDSAIALLKAGGTSGEMEMIRDINKTRDYLKKVGREELMEDTNRATFHSTLLKELHKRNELNMEVDVMHGYVTYDLVKDRVRKLLNIQQSASKKLDKEKVTTEETVTQQFKDMYAEARANFQKMGRENPKGRLLVIGGLLVGTVMLMTSENPKVQKFKNFLWSTLKIGGLALTANYAYQMFTGKTAVEAVTDYAEKGVSSDKFWMEAYDTDAEKAALVEKSLLYFGDKDFMQVAKAHREAKDGKMSLPGVSNMKPEEIFLAADTFFKKYPREGLELKYRNSKRTVNWTSVVTAEMIEDSTIDVPEGITERAYEDVREYAIRGWNGFWVTTEGAGLVRPLYLKVYGKDPDEAELEGTINKLRGQLEKEVPTESELASYLSTQSNLSETSRKQYNQLLISGKRDTKHQSVKFMEIPGDSVYVMSESKLDTSLDSKASVNKMLSDALNNAEEFLKSKYPDASENIYKFVNLDEVRGVRVTENGTFKLFIRMPIKGSPEYNRKAVMAVPPAGRKEKAGVEIFGVNDTIEYGKMEKFEQERLRMLFLLDVSQKGEIDKVCKWLTDYFKTKSMTVEQVRAAIFEDEDLRKKAVEELNLKQGLLGNFDLLHSWEGKISDIEKNAAAAFDTTVMEKLYPPNWFAKVSDAYEPLIGYMQKSVGYKIRLAILGDKEARTFWSNQDPKMYSPDQNPDWIENILRDYKKECKRFVDEYESGNVRFDKP